MKIRSDIQKRFGDTDMLGHINNINMMHYFDYGKVELFRQVLGFRVSTGDLGLITASVNTSYLEQTRFDDNNYVETSIERLGNKSITVFQQLVDADTGIVNAESRTVLVVFNFKNQVSTEIPELWRVKLSE